MKKQDLEEFRRLLLDRRREILGDIQGLNRESADQNRSETIGGGLSKLPTHNADVATDEYERQMSLRLTQGERNMLLEIDQALRRIEDGTYGVCEADDAPIPKRRLRAKPWARYCIAHTPSEKRM